MENISFEEDYNLDLECKGLLYHLKYRYKKKIFAIRDISYETGGSEKDATRVLRRVIGYGYIRRSLEAGDWEMDPFLYQKSPNLYQWKEKI